MTPEMNPRLSTIDAVALALAYYGEENRCSEAVPQAVWDSLHERGLVQTTRDITGEGATVTTRAGFDALLATIEESHVAA